MKEKKKNNWLEKLKKSTDLFWSETYPAKTAEEKQAYWSALVQKALKEAEKNGEELSQVFSPSWWQEIKAQDAQAWDYLDKSFPKAEFPAIWSSCPQD